MFLLKRKAREPFMTWFKVDDSFHSHPKVLATEPAALGLWVIAGSWSSDNLTEGFVPDHVLPRLLPDSAKLARALVTAGLWKRMQGGYTFHDWTDFNPTAEQEKRKKQARAEAGRKGGLASGRTRSKPPSKTEANASPVASVLLEPPSRPVPSVVDVSNQQSRRNTREDHPENRDDVILAVQKQMKTTTKRTVDADEARRIAASIFGSAKGPVGNPPGYAAEAIRREPNPAVRWPPRKPEPHQPGLTRLLPAVRDAAPEPPGTAGLPAREPDADPAEHWAAQARRLMAEKSREVS